MVRERFFKGTTGSLMLSAELYCEQKCKLNSAKVKGDVICQLKECPIIDFLMLIAKNRNEVEEKENE